MRPFSHESLRGQPLCSVCPRDILTHLFFCRQTFLAHQPADSLGSGSPLWTSLNTMHTAGAQQLFVRHRLGSRKKRRGSQTPSKRGASFPPPPPSPSTAQLPGYCPRPGRHLLWVISICMAIITAFGEKIPLSKSPAELLMPAQNGRRQVRQSSRLLPIMQELPVPAALHPAPKSTAAPAGSLGQPGPLRASPLPQSRLGGRGRVRWGSRAPGAAREGKREQDQAGIQP